MFTVFILKTKSRNRAMCHALNVLTPISILARTKFCQLHRQFNVIFLHRIILYNSGENCYNFEMKCNGHILQLRCSHSLMKLHYHTP